MNYFILGSPALPLCLWARTRSLDGVIALDAEIRFLSLPDEPLLDTGLRYHWNEK